jgi:hypothetical protein
MTNLKIQDGHASMLLDGCRVSIDANLGEVGIRPLEPGYKIHLPAFPLPLTLVPQQGRPGCHNLTLMHGGLVFQAWLTDGDGDRLLAFLKGEAAGP